MVTPRQAKASEVGDVGQSGDAGIIDGVFGNETDV
jgi:hypothetical protein